MKSLLFLFLSGYGCSASYQKHNGFNHYWKNKILKVLVPFQMIQIPYSVFLLLSGAECFSIGGILYVFGLNPYSGYDITMWFIPYALYWYTSFYLYKKNGSKLSILVLEMLISFFALKYIFDPGAFIQQYTLFFPAGILYSEIVSKKIPAFSAPIAITIVILSLLTYLNTGLNTGKFDAANRIIYYTVLYINEFSALVTVVFTIKFFTAFTFPKMPPCSTLGKITYFMYLTEWIQIQIWPYFLPLLGKQYLSAFVFIASNLLISYLLTFAADCLTKKINGMRFQLL